VFTYPHGFIGRGGVGPWEYGTIAAAESSGDPWVDGDQVTITGGAVFTYLDSLDVSGYSGLIHKYPWDGVGTLGTIDAATINLSEAEGVDPDSWTGWTDTSSGSKGTDYEFDVDGGLARFRDLTSSGKIVYNTSSDVVSSDVITFFIIDDITTVDGAFPGGAGVHIRSLRAYISAGNSVYVRLDGDTDSNFWRINHTDSSTFAVTDINRKSSQRMFLYLKSGRWAAWGNAEGTPNQSGTSPRALTSMSIGGISVGYDSSGPYTQTQGAMLFGRLTEA